MYFFRFIFILALSLSAHIMSAPKVMSVTPSNGPSAGENTVIIRGKGFHGTTSVHFGDRTATDFVVDSDHKITAVAPAGTPGTVDVVVRSHGKKSYRNANDFYTYTQSGWEGILSVMNPNNVTYFDTSTNLISALTSLPSISLASIITPDGTTIYAIDSAAPAVYVIDAATKLIIGTISLPADPLLSTTITTTRVTTTFQTPGAGAFDIIVSPDGKKLYVSNNLTGYVTVIDIDTQQITGHIFVVGNLGSLSITPDGKTVYVANFNFSANTVSIIDTTTNTVIGNLSTGLSPGAVSITPDGQKGYVGNSLTDTVTIIDIPTNTVIGSIALPSGSGPYGSFILPNSQFLYVANIYNNSVTVIDTTTDLIVDTIAVLPGSGPFWVVATPDSKTVYVADLTSSNVTPIDVATNIAGAPIANTGGSIEDIVMSPDPAPVAAFTVTGTTIGAPTVFNASDSISPIGTIASYAWDFGDSTTLVTTSPIASHTYASQEFFDVQLTVTNTAGTSTEKIFSSRFMSNNGGPTATIIERIGIAPSSPTDLRACRNCFNKCAINYLQWNPPETGIPPISYRIYRNHLFTDPIATIPPGQPLVFRDICCGSSECHKYLVVAVSEDGTASEPAEVRISENCCSNGNACGF